MKTFDKLTQLEKGIMLNSYGAPLVAKAKLRKVKLLPNPKSLTISSEVGHEDRGRVLQDSLANLVRDLDQCMTTFLYDKSKKLTDDEKVINNCAVVLDEKVFILGKMEELLQREDHEEVALINRLGRKGYFQTSFSAMGVRNSMLPECVMFLHDPPVILKVEEDIKLIEDTDGVFEMTLNYEFQLTKPPVIILERTQF